MPGITYLWITFHLTTLWSYIVYYCKMSSCFSIAHQTEWGKSFIMYVFNGFFPADCRSPSPLFRPPHPLPGWLTFRPEWRQRKWKKGFSPKRDCVFSTLLRGDLVNATWNQNGWSCPVICMGVGGLSMGFCYVGKTHSKWPLKSVFFANKLKKMQEPSGYN